MGVISITAKLLKGKLENVLDPLISERILYRE
jgi:hypothetical protein